MDSFHHQRFPWSGGDVTRGRRGQDADVTAASPSSDSTAEEGETARVDGSRQLIIITMITANKKKERERERERNIYSIDCGTETMASNCSEMDWNGTEWT